MTLSLTLGTKPKGLKVKTSGLNPEIIFVGDYELSMEDFLCAAKYILANTDLQTDDPRLQFLDCVKSMKIVNGHNLGGIRLETSVPPIPVKNR